VNVTYAVSDGTDATEGGVTLTYDGVNDKPTISGSVALDGVEDQTLTITIAELLMVANDAEGDVLSIVNLEADSGALVDNGNGTWDLTPDPDFSGIINLAYGIGDGKFVTAASASVTVAGVNDAPVFHDGTPWVDNYALLISEGNADGNSSVTALSDGRFIVAWDHLSNGISNVYAQLYEKNGDAIGSKFQVNTYDLTAQTKPKVASLSGGGFVVVWNSFEQDGSSYGVFAQQYNALGEVVGQEFQVNTHSESTQLTSDVIGLDNGNYIVTWWSIGGSGLPVGTYAQMYNASGDALGNEFYLAYGASIAPLEGGGFIVNSTVGYNVFWQRYNAAGELQGDAFSINPQTVEYPKHSNVSVLPNGGYVIFWEPQDFSEPALYGQIYDSNGNPISSEFKVNASSNYQQRSYVVAITKDGEIVVTWQAQNQETYGFDIYAQRFSESGIKIGTEMIVPSNGYSLNTDNTVLTDGRLVVTSGVDTLKMHIVDMEEGAGFDSIIKSGVEDQSFVITEEEMLSIASDVDGDLLSVSNVSSDAGSIVKGDGNTWIFTPENDFTGDVVISYDVNDGAKSTRGRLNLIYNNVNDAPVVSGPVTLTVIEDTALRISAENLLSTSSDVDADTLSVSNLTTDSGLLVEIRNGLWELTPDAEFFGTINLTYNVNDGEYSIPATAAVTVAAVNDAPVLGTPVLANGIENVSYILNASDLLVAASDIEGDNLSLVSLSIDIGSVTDNGDGTFTIVQATGFDGGVIVTYGVSDGVSTTEGTATLTYDGVNDAPVVSDPVTLTQSRRNTVLITTAELLANATDFDGDSLSVVNLTSDAGTLVDNGNDTWNLTLAIGFTGTVNLSYEVSDGTANIETLAVLDVTNDAPVLGDPILVNGTEDVSYTLNASELLSTVLDFQGDNLSLAYVNVDKGTIEDNGDGTYTISQAENFYGEVVISYSVTDGTDTTEGSVMLTYDAANDAPVVSFNPTRINDPFTVDFEGRNWDPNVTGLSDGSFVVIWQNSGGVEGGDYFEVVGQKYDPSGNKVGEPFHVNSYVDSTQNFASATPLDNGGFVVTWWSYGQDGSHGGIYAQTYDAVGVKVGSEFRVNSHADDQQSSPRITSLEDGGFVITWSSDNQDGDGGGVYAQRYDSDGQTVGTEFLVNTTTEGEQRSGSITGLKDGGYLLSWSVKGQDAAFAQRYDAQGQPVGAERQIFDSKYYEIISLESGGYVVSGMGEYNGKYTLGGQVYDALDNPVGEPFGVEPSLGKSETYSWITELSDGSFIVAGQNYLPDYTGRNIFAQRFNQLGQQVGSVFNLHADPELNLRNASVTSLGNNKFAVISLHDDTYTIVGQVYEASPLSEDGTQVILKRAQEDQSLTITEVELLGTTSDVDGDALSVVGLTSDTGTLVDNGDGTWSLTPADDFVGTITLSYSVTDGIEATATSTFVEVSNANDAPVLGTPVLVNGTEDISYTLNASDLLATATDIDGDSLSVSGVTVDTGNIIDNGDGTWTVTQVADFNGAITVSYDVTDGTATESNSVSLTYDAANDAPVLGAPVLANGTEDVAYTLNGSDLLASATDVDGDSLSVSGVTVDSGSIIDNGDGTYTITQVQNFNGDVTVSYDVTDGTATVSNSVVLTIDSVGDTVSGQAIDGYIEGATIFADANGNGVYDDGEAQTVTGTDGVYSLENAEGSLILSGGIDAATNLAFTGILKAPDGSSVITPVTTLISSLVEQGTVSSVADAQTVLKDAFGIGATVDLLSFDPVVSLDDGDPHVVSEASNLAALGVKIQNTIVQMTAVLSGASSETANNITDVLYDKLAFAINAGSDLNSASALEEVINETANDPSLTVDWSVVRANITSIAKTVSDLNVQIDRVASIADSPLELLTEVSKVAIVANEFSDGLSSAIADGDQTTIDTMLENYSGVNLNTELDQATAKLGDVDGNDAPVLGTPVLGNGTEDVSYTLNAADLLATATDIDGDALSLSNVTVSAGTITDNADGTYTITQSSDFNGAITVSYEVSDGTVSVGGTASITYDAVNDAPVVSGSVHLSATEDQSLLITEVELLANASDIDGDSLSVIGLSTDAGTLVDNLDGTWSLAPAADFVGTITLSYSVTDGTASTAASASVAVANVNDAPVLGTPVLGNGTEDVSYTLNAADLLATATDIDGDALSVSNVTVSAGTITDNADGTYSITQSPDFNGAITVSYDVSDGTVTESGTASITYDAVNDAPVVSGSANLSATEDQSLLITEAELLGNASDVDGDSLSVMGLATDAGTLVDNLDGTWSLAPASDFVGTITLSYSITDGAASTAASASVAVTNVNEAPVLGTPVLGNGTEDVSYTLNASDLLATATDIDGDALSLSNVTVSAGTITDNADGTYTITQSSDFNGAITVSYEVSDGTVSVGGTAWITYDAVNEAPLVSGSVNLSGTEDQSLLITEAELLANASDVDGDDLSITALTSDAGTLVDNLDGTWSLAPAADFVGTITLSYSVTDGTEVTPATVSVDVENVNDAPVLQSQLFGFPSRRYGPMYVDIQENLPAGSVIGQFHGVDVDNDALSYSIVAGNEAGLFEIDAVTGIVKTTAPLNYEEVSSYVLTVQVSDGEFSDDNTAEITVLDVNEGPVVSDLVALSGQEGQVLVISEAELLATSLDEDGDTLSVQNLMSDTGTVVDNGDGTWSFTPEADFNGTINLSYDVSDGMISSSAYASVEISNVNDNPVSLGIVHINDNNASSITISEGDLLAQVHDVDGDTLVVQNLVSSLGDLIDNGDGSWQLNFGENYNGVIELSYEVFDGQYPLSVKAYVTNDNVWINSVGNNVAHGTTGDDVFVFTGNDNGFDILYGGDGQDTVLGGSGDDVIGFERFGLEHSIELIDGGAGYNVIANNSPYNVKFTHTVLTNIDEISGHSGTDYIYGSQGNDTIKGNAGNDSLYGGLGDDVIEGGAGNDYLKGEEGADTYFFSRGDGQDYIQNVGHGVDGDKILFNNDISSEQLWFKRVDYALEISIIGTEDSITVQNWFGGGGANVISSIVAGDGKVLYAENVQELADIMSNYSQPMLGEIDLPADSHTQISDDLEAYWGLQPGRWVTSDNNDVAHGTTGDDVFVFTGNDNGFDILYGGDGQDTVLGGSGDDVIGFERFGHEHSIELIDGGAGYNVIANNSPYNVKFTHTVLTNIDEISGHSGTDYIYGSQGNDTIKGNAGDDSLYGGLGDDVIEGGGGNDYILGNEGADTFKFSRGDGQDQIRNFGEGSSGDKIVFGNNIDSDQLWFRRNDYALEVSIIGTEDSVSIENWFGGGGDNVVSSIETSSGETLLSSKVHSLVDAMASFTPPALGETELSATIYNDLEGIITQSWD
jgi:Ca2+-binding RTX toxin-like protein